MEGEGLIERLPDSTDRLTLDYSQENGCWLLRYPALLNGVDLLPNREMVASTLKLGFGIVSLQPRSANFTLRGEIVSREKDASSCS